MFLKKKILIGIVTYNRRKLLQRCISAIIPQIQDINLKADLLITKYKLKEGRNLGDKLKLIEKEWVNNNFKITDKEVESIVNN